MLNNTENNTQLTNNEGNLEKWQVILQTMVLVFIMVLTIIGNSLVCLCIYFKKEMRTVTGIFLVGLAISDLGVGVFCTPIALAAHLNVAILEDQWLCSLNAFFLVLFFIASINTLSVTSVYKYVIVVYPWHQLITKPRAMFVNVLIWILAFVLAVGPIFGWSEYRLVKGRYQCSPHSPSNNNELSHLTMLLVFGYLLPLVTMVFCYSRVYMISKRHIKRMKTHSTIDRTFLLSETRLIKTFLIIVFGFFLCWLPFAVYVVFGILHIKIPVYLPTIAFYLGYSNAFLNPIVFALRLDSFRKGFKDAIMLFSRKKTFIRAYFSHDTDKVETTTKQSSTSRVEVSVSSKNSRKKSSTYFVQGTDNKSFVVDGPNVAYSSRKTSKYRRESTSVSSNGPTLPNSRKISKYRKESTLVNVNGPSLSDASRKVSKHRKASMPASPNGEINGVFVIEEYCDNDGAMSNINEFQNVPEDTLSSERSFSDATLNNDDDDRDNVITLTEVRYEEFKKRLKLCNHTECICYFGDCNVSRCITTEYEIHVIKDPTNEEVLCYGDPCIHKVLKSVTWEDTILNSVACVVLKSRHEGVKNKIINNSLLPSFMREHVKFEI